MMGGPEASVNRLQAFAECAGRCTTAEERRDRAVVPTLASLGWLDSSMTPFACADFLGVRLCENTRVKALVLIQTRFTGALAGQLDFPYRECGLSSLQDVSVWVTDGEVWVRYERASFGRWVMKAVVTAQSFPVLQRALGPTGQRGLVRPGTTGTQSGAERETPEAWLPADGQRSPIIPLSVASAFRGRDSVSFRAVPKGHLRYTKPCCVVAEGREWSLADWSNVVLLAARRCLAVRGEVFNRPNPLLRCWAAKSRRGVYRGAKVGDGWWVQTCMDADWAAEYAVFLFERGGVVGDELDVLVTLRPEAEVAKWKRHAGTTR
ncbi:hypothetical protein LBMAG42_51630 [Deltaproteobacteria bacterium]|nr:hypothetical protein LBMAG42_51630 [Deltaproteobacteria bacterium]